MRPIYSPLCEPHNQMLAAQKLKVGIMLSTPPQNNGAFEIAPGVLNTDWQALKLTADSSIVNWKKAVEMFRKRVGRFTEPVQALMESTDTNVIVFSGFAIMALDCLLIETLQSFRTGRPNPVRSFDRLSTKMIVDFLSQRTSFKAFFDPTKAALFCDHFRNGILHQGEVKSSGRIRIDTPKMVLPSEDNQSFIINRWLFHNALVTEIKEYINELVDGKDIELRKSFIKKMNEICRIPAA